MLAVASTCHTLSVIARLNRAIQYSRDSDWIRRSCGVLDARFRGHDGGVCGAVSAPYRSGFFSNEKRSGSSPIDGCSIGASTLESVFAGGAENTGSFGTSRCEVAPRQRSSTAPTKMHVVTGGDGRHAA